ncbi:hypothetical protein DIM_25180 [Candidatus Denitrolinea symbiosum]|nr:hypothetical protein DIM_25180 [Candidatus Denitrolinea symbiosum]
MYTDYTDLFGLFALFARFAVKISEIKSLLSSWKSLRDWRCGPKDFQALRRDFNPRRTRKLAD